MDGRFHLKYSSMLVVEKLTCIFLGYMYLRSYIIDVINKFLYI